jgi:voltage-gated potassium channel
MRLKIRRVARFIHRKLVNRPVTAVLALLVFIYVLATALIMISENVAFGDATARIMPAFLGELGIVESESVVTQISCLVALVVSVAFLAIITAKITSMFIEFCRRGGSMVKKVNLSEHIVICGWNFQGERMIDQLLSGGGEPIREIVVLADCEQRPVQDERVEFVRGDPTQDEALMRAGIKKASSVIVLTDLTKRGNEADAEALMIVLAVESLNRAVHTSVQIMNSSNRIHMERAHADEIICVDQMGGHLVVASTVNHGVSRVVSELLTFNSGSEFYRYDGHLSDKLVGKGFREVVQSLVPRGIILLGFETDDAPELRRSMPDDVIHSVGEGKRVIVVNPQGEYKIRQGDALFLIAEEEPAAL